MGHILLFVLVGRKAGLSQPRDVSVQKAGISTELHTLTKSKSDFVQCSGSARFLTAFLTTSFLNPLYDVFSRTACFRT